jgi:steroid 5-alpha reductase family enzyme
MLSISNHPEVFFATAAVTFTAVLVMWAVSLARHDASVVDPFWGPGFVLIAATAYTIGAGFEPRRLLVAGMVAIWGLRLGFYLLGRNLHEGEDRRYAAMRNYWGASFWWVSLGTVFLLQGVLMWIISLPIQVVMVASTPDVVTATDVGGLIFWGVGMYFEAVGDLQMRRFKSDPGNRGKVMDRGLWRYTRHPNYFGDAMVWWGIFLVAASVPGGVWTAISPLLMTFFLVKVSGVAMLERDIATRRPAYRDYIRSTSAFIPWPPKPRTADSSVDSRAVGTSAKPGEAGAVRREDRR